MRVLVTGAGGFVGKILVPYLVAEGHEVVAASRSNDVGLDLTDKTGGNVSASSTTEAQRTQSLTERVGDRFRNVQITSVGPDTDWSAALKGTDAVVHLAARAHVLKEQCADPLAEHRRVNTEGTRRLAEQAQEFGVKRFVFISSIGVNGNNSLKARNGHSFTEMDEPNPHDDYSRSKWEAEQALSAINGLERVVIRPPLIYGPGVPGNFRRLLQFARKGQRFPLGAVRNKRSLIGVRNLTAFIEKTLAHERAVDQTYLIADKETRSTADLYQTLCTLMDKRPRLINVPEPVLRAMLRAIGKQRMADRLCDTLVVDFSKAVEELDWQQQISQLEGLKETAKWAST